MTSMDGAWGVRFPSMGETTSILGGSLPGWPEVAVSTTVDPTPPELTVWGADAAQYALAGGNHIKIQRTPAVVELTLRAPTVPECVVAPHLTSAASTIGVWMGRMAFHAGAVLLGNGAWILAGDKGSGKSSTLGWLARAGVPVITDDLVVCERGKVLAGPRCVDLRPEAARALEAGRPLGFVGTRERWRVYLDRCLPDHPLRGWVFLEWGEAPSLDRLRPGELLPRIPHQRALRLPMDDPAGLLDLAARPGFVWRRPQRWKAADQAFALLLKVLNEI